MNNTMPRFIRIGLVALAALLPTSLSAQLVKLKVSTNQSIDAAAFEAARVLGYFADEGLEVDVTPIVGGAAGLPALAAGQAQVVASNLISIILGAKNGLPFRIVAAGDATFDNPPDLAGLVAPTTSNLKTGKDFEGKRIAVNARNGIIWLFARSWVEATGGDPNKVTYVEVPFPQMIAAVRLGRVDGAFVVEPFLSNGVETGIAKVVGWPYSTVQKRAPISQWVMTQSYIDRIKDRRGLRACPRPRCRLDQQEPRFRQGDRDHRQLHEDRAGHRAQGRHSGFHQEDGRRQGCADD